MTQAVQQKSWFSRNWIWVVPVSGCLMIILLFIFGVGAAIFGVTKIITNSEPYEYAFDLAKTDERVLNILGDPIESDGIMQGNISISNSEGEANFRIPIKGPKAAAYVQVVAERYAGDWEYEELYVIIKETNEKINLLDQGLEGI